MGVYSLSKTEREILAKHSGGGEYSPKNPKIDIFIEGRYVASTNFYRTCAEYLAGFEDTHRIAFNITARRYKP